MSIPPPPSTHPNIIGTQGSAGPMPAVVNDAQTNITRNKKRPPAPSSRPKIKSRGSVDPINAAPKDAQPHITQAENAFTTVQTALTGNQVSLTNNNTIAPERKVDSTLKSESFDYRVKIDPTQTILSLPNDPNTYEIDKLISIAKNYPFSWKHIFVHLNNNAYSANNIVEFLSSIEMNHLTDKELKAAEDLKKKLESNPLLTQATQKALTDINNNLKSAKTRNIITRMFQFFNKKLINKIIDKVTTDDSWKNVLIKHTYLSNKFIESLNVKLLRELKEKNFDQWNAVSSILVNMTGQHNYGTIHLSDANIKKLQEFSKYDSILYQNLIGLSQ